MWEKSRLIAEVFDVTLDELVNYEGGETRLPFPPKESMRLEW